MKPIVEIQQLSKKFQIQTSGNNSYKTLRDSITSFLKEKSIRNNTEDFWALKDVSFDINTGDTIGIIGRNGAGKSTLLKILSKITPPTSGKIICRGRIASLLEVGTGFHSELSGRENVFLNGSILGMKKKEIASKFDEIVSFSGVEKFIDTPLKHYSSGMQLRLAFAVAAFLEPEILVIDEVLAVGDSEFQKKCMGKMNEVSKSGRTILFVSHNMGAIKELCNKSVLLQKGKLIAYDNTTNIINEYLNTKTSERSTFELTAKPNTPVYIHSIDIKNKKGDSTKEFSINDPVDIHFQYTVLEKIPGWRIEFRLYRNNNCVITSFNTDKETYNASFNEKGEQLGIISLPNMYLKSGYYSATFIIQREADGSHIQTLLEVVSFVITSEDSNLFHKGYKPERAGDTIFQGNWNIKN